MSEANSPVALARPLLVRLAAWWRLSGRRADTEALLGILTRVETQLLKTLSRLQTSQGQRTAISANLQELQQAHDAQGSSYDELLQKHARLERAHTVSQFEKSAFLEELRELQRGHEVLVNSHDALIQIHAELERTHGILQVEQRSSQEAFDAQSIAHQQLQVTHGLISQVLGARPDEHSKYLAFSRLFREDFMAFANAENIYGREAEAVQRLHAVADELRLLGRVPVFREKSIVAVAGGFSSGKSSFVSSFFDTNRKIRLPIGIEPVTAIPTYVVHGERARVVGFPAQGGAIDIAPDLYAQLKHEFVEALGFDLKRILPFIAIENPWREPMQHLCLIDTPGYNPAISSGQTETDGEATGEALRQADAVLWVLGLDSNGDIPQSDLEYLAAHSPGLPLGVVLNKADCRPKNAIESVIDQVSETLELYGIEYLGITAYSSVEQTEYACRGHSLAQMMNEWNRASNRQGRLIEEIKDVFSAYLHAFEEEIAARKQRLGVAKSQKLDLYELGVMDEDAPIRRSQEEKPKGTTPVPEVVGSLWKVLAKAVSGRDDSGTDEDLVDERKDVERMTRRNTVRSALIERLDRMAGQSKTDDLDMAMAEARRLQREMTEVIDGDW